MKKTTTQIIRAALSADDTVDRGRIDSLVAMLDEGHALNPAAGPEPLLLTTMEAARMLNVSRWTVRELARDGTLRPVRVRAALRFRREDVVGLARGGAGSGAEPIVGARRLHFRTDDNYTSADGREV